jgi:hypothetical protein
VLGEGNGLRPQRLRDPATRGGPTRAPLGKLVGDVVEVFFDLSQRQWCHAFLPSCPQVFCDRKVSALYCESHACSPEAHSTARRCPVTFNDRWRGSFSATWHPAERRATAACGSKANSGCTPISAIKMLPLIRDARHGKPSRLSKEITSWPASR